MSATRIRFVQRTARILLSYSLLCWVVGCELRAETSVLPDPSNLREGIWISREEVALLPMEGPAWEAVVAQAQLAVPSPDLADQDDPSNVRVLAKALFAARTGNEKAAREVRNACAAIRGTEGRASALAIGRELLSYILAADIVGLEDRERALFEQWLRKIQRRSFKGRSIRSTHEDRPNNWGTHAGATRIAMAAYLGDEAEIARAAHVFYGWTGEEAGWQRFEFGAGDWQPEGTRRYAVNPAGVLRQGHSIAGVLPDDQRRAGAFRWPPPKENYVYEALQGAVVQAAMLDRLGFGAWEWGDRAILRAMVWLDEEANFPAEGDDTWIPHLVNRAYGSEFPAHVPTRPGKAMGFTDWTHASRAAVP